MLKCPICQTEYTEGKANNCTCCDYDLTPYPATIGQIPTPFLEKERVKLAWAIKQWATSQTLREQLNQEKSQFQQVLAKLEQVGQAPSQDIMNALTQLSSQLTDIKNELQLKSQLEQTEQQLTMKETALRQGQTELAQAQAEISRLQAELEKFNPPKPNQREFSFEVVTVNGQGAETQRRRQQVQFFSEDMGNGVILEMVSIPGGTFFMGSPDNEAQRESYESPRHQVQVAPFYMGKFPITQAQWRVVAALPQVEIALEADPSNFKGENLPVEGVSWYQAVEFCARIKQKTGRNYSLPSEAQWEYACRAGTTTPFHFGETITADLANYDGNHIYGSGPKGKFRQQTTPVGSFQVANSFGLYDMHGNVWEWCADQWHENYNIAPPDGSVWNMGGDDQYRLLRGGAWSSDPWFCRAARRLRFAPDSRYYNVGFRVVACSVAWTL